MHQSPVLFLFSQKKEAHQIEGEEAMEAGEDAFNEDCRIDDVVNVDDNDDFSSVNNDDTDDGIGMMQNAEKINKQNKNR